MFFSTGARGVCSSVAQQVLSICNTLDLIPCTAKIKVKWNNFSFFCIIQHWILQWREMPRKLVNSFGAEVPWKSLCAHLFHSSFPTSVSSLTAAMCGGEGGITAPGQGLCFQALGPGATLSDGCTGTPQLQMPFSRSRRTGHLKNSFVFSIKGCHSWGHDRGKQRCSLKKAQSTC